MTVASVPATSSSLPFVRRAHQNNPLHPNLAIPYESHLYNGSYPAIRRYADFRHPRTRALLVAEILRTEHIRRWTPAPSLTETLESITRYDSTASWTVCWGVGLESREVALGEKTPQHTLC